MTRRALTGSTRRALAGARLIGPADPHERLEVSVVLRRQGKDAFAARLTRADRSVGWLTRAQLESAHGASASDIEAVRAFARKFGLAVVQEHAARRTLILSGTVAQFSEAFEVRLNRYEHPGGTYRGREGVIEIPEELAEIVVAVLGLDNRPQARPHFRVRPARGRTRAAAAFTPTQVATLYGFPAGAGAGECVALIELGGGFRPADLQTYFASLKLSAPQVTAVSVDHASNAPSGDPNGADGEVMLDIEVVGAVAPGASIAVYFAPNTDAGFLDALTTAIHDTTNKPSVLSISWGGPESSWTEQAMSAMDEALQSAATLGITVCVASGDSGSSDGVASGTHVDFPASSPYALACGGTRLSAARQSITAEVVWNDGSESGGAGGGGVSSFFPLPAWQHGLEVTATSGTQSPLSGRGVPDVAGDADPQSGYKVRIDGSDTVIGGTSAVAPLWAALIARLNASTGRAAGYLNPLLYAHPAALRDITQGNNGAFAAAPGSDACTGLGSPNGTAIAQLPSI
jgi:kumamolisin